MSLNFHDPKLDRILVLWLQGDASSKDREAIESAILSDPRFRESFADWIRSLREPRFQQESEDS